MMGWQERIPKMIEQRFGDLNISEIARRAGIKVGAMHRIATGSRGGPPGFESLMRLCHLAGESPVPWFEAAGHVEMAHLLKETCGKVDAPEDASFRHDFPELYILFEAMLARGLAAKAGTMLQHLDSAIDPARSYFRQAAQASGADSAVLVAHHRIPGDVVEAFQCSPVDARALARAGKQLPQGWWRKRRPLTTKAELVLLAKSSGGPEAGDWDACLQFCATMLAEAWDLPGQALSSGAPNGAAE
ncbi:MAG TPA: hypothetical protein VLV83_19120 [Acidobacteriota bacterium]|nr:hypothetical protein [Acidobacteriota bacterium]